MKSSKIKAVVLSMSMCMSVVASSGISTNVAKADDEPVTVNIFSFGIEYTDEENELAELYMSQNPNVTINVEMGDNEVLRTKMASGDQPTIFGIDGAQDILDWSEYLEDLSDQPWVEHAYEGLLDSFTVDGKIYAAPAALQGYGFIYNKRIFEAAGIDVAGLTTYEAIDEAFANLQQQIENGDLADEFPALEAVMETAASEYWIYGKHTTNMAFALEFNDAMTALDADTIDFTYADALKELTDMQVRYTAYADTPANLNAVDYSMQIGGGFAIERVAVIQEGTWVYAEINNIDPEVAQNMGFLPLPMKGATEDCIAVGSTGTVINSQADPDSIQAGKEYLNWRLTDPEAQAIAISYGLVLPYDNVEGTEKLDPLNLEMLSYLDAGKTINWVFSSYPTGFAETMNGLFQSYLSGTITWDEIVEQAKADWMEKRAQ